MLRAGSIWFPLATVVSMMAAVIWCTQLVVSEKSKIDVKIDNLSAAVQSLSDTVKTLVLSRGKLDGDYVTRQQWLIDCLQLQILNPTWRCVYGVPGSWTTSTEVPTAR